MIWGRQPSAAQQLGSIPPPEGKKPERQRKTWGAFPGSACLGITAHIGAISFSPKPRRSSPVRGSGIERNEGVSSGMWRHGAQGDRDKTGFRYPLANYLPPPGHGSIATSVVGSSEQINLLRCPRARNGCGICSAADG